jgi:hypothetical protein
MLDELLELATDDLLLDEELTTMLELLLELLNDELAILELVMPPTIP